ncbi:MAG: hypothetical protein IJB98_03505 [Clostridia bacterium]|nr:hypothetical protein [Clostridia bacterium]
MEKRNFVIGRTKNGILVKRFYNVVKDEYGMPKREFYASEKLNLPEKLAYKFIKTFDMPKSSQKKSRLMTNATKLFVATLLAGAAIISTTSLALSGIGARSAEPTIAPTKNDSYYSEQGTMPSQDKNVLPPIVEKTPEIKHETGYVVPETPPAPVTYIDNGVEFVSLESIIEISKYNHAQLVKEIEEYNKTAPADKQIEFDAKLFDAEFFAAIAIQENSLKTKSPSNPNHYGCYQIGSMAYEEAQLMAEKLGTELPDNLKDLENPLYGNKASMYIYVQNYNRYLKKSMKEQGYNKEQIKAATTTAYLFGGPSTAGKIRKGEFVDSVYHTKIDSYAKIVREFSDQLYNEGLVQEDKAEERAAARRNAFAKLYTVTNESASKILEEKKAQAQQSEQEQ